MGFMYSSGSETVDRMGQIDFSFGGAVNMIPDTWYKVIRYDSGKTNTNACLILSEIVYWYRPKVEKDKNTGQLLPWQKKFDSDLLQKSYQELADNCMICPNCGKVLGPGAKFCGGCGTRIG